MSDKQEIIEVKPEDVARSFRTARQFLKESRENNNKGDDE